MKSVFIASGSRENIEKGVHIGISVETLKLSDQTLKKKLTDLYLGDKAHLWGLKNKPFLRTQWNQVNEDDYILFYASGLKEFTYASKMAFKYPFNLNDEKQLKEAERIAETTWGRDEEGTWPLLIFLKPSSIWPLNLTLQDYERIAGKDATVFLKGFTELSEEIAKKLIELVEPTKIESTTSLSFEGLLTTDDWKDFEKGIARLLKAIGINDLYVYEKQAGQPDGFFVIGNLAVIYDATLSERFEEKKDQQIENYCNMLGSSEISAYRRGIKESINIGDKSREVWIITRGATSRSIKGCRRGPWSIKVKEISVKDLIDIYNKRIEDLTINEDELVEMLRSLGNKYI